MWLVKLETKLWESYTEVKQENDGGGVRWKGQRECCFSHLSLPSPIVFSFEWKTHKKNCTPCRLKLPKTSSRNTSFYLFIFIFICLLFCKWPLCIITSDGQISPPSSLFLSKILCICTLCAWVFFSNVLPWKFIDM